MLTRFIGGDHFRTCTRTESLCDTPETNTVFYVKYISIKNRKGLPKG